MKLRIVLALAVAMVACERDIELTLPPTPTPHATPTAQPSGDDAAGCAETALLADPQVADDAKLAAVGRLAADTRDRATRCLVTATLHPSILVSMASIKALGGRPCTAVEAALIRLVDDAAWERRAWAAKVLGDNRCGNAADPLAARRKREDDERVRERLDAALAALGRAPHPD